jgi:hypothetical protein
MQNIYGGGPDKNKDKESFSSLRKKLLAAGITPRDDGRPPEPPPMPPPAPAYVAKSVQSNPARQPKSIKPAKAFGARLSSPLFGRGVAKAMRGRRAPLIGALGEGGDGGRVGAVQLPAVGRGRSRIPALRAR